MHGAGDDKVLIIDAGTGIYELGKQLEQSKRQIFVLLTHNHWDHVQGFPFFAPIYQEKRPIYIFAPHTSHLNELHPPDQPTTSFDKFVDFCSGVDVLIHDAQYLEEDMPHKHGCGHSLVSQACQLASAARAKHLVLFHHDPDRVDGQVDSIQKNARSGLRQNDFAGQCTAAYEGLIFSL